MLKNIKGHIMYVVYAFLVLFICMLFFSISYSSLNRYDYLRLNIDGKKVILQNSLQYIDNNLYVSYEDVAQALKEDIFKESALKKVIVTANDMIKTYTLNSNVSHTNFEEDEQDSIKYTAYEGEEYILLSELCNIYGYVEVEDKTLNVVNVLKGEFQEVDLKYTRVYGYVNKDTKKDKVVLDKGTKILAVKTEEYYDASSKYVLCIIEQDTKKVVYIPKENLNIELTYVEEDTENSFKTFVQNEDNLKITKSENLDTYYIYSAFKLVSSAGNVECIYDISKLDGVTYAMITNGFKAANYDNSITTYVLQNMVSRQTVISSIAENVKDTVIKGVVVNFRDFKVASTQYFTQFVKELSMYMHSIGKEVVVYVPLNVAYIDAINILPYVDNCIFIEYGVKSENSKTSGTDSSPKFIEESVAKIKEELNLKGWSKYLNKVIIEIPMYSVLWTEKEQKVISMQYMYSSALADYIAKNNLTPILDDASGQMYVEQTKGSLTYKMWMEDEYSINQKTNIAKENLLGGVSLYKKGYEPAGIDM